MNLLDGIINTIFGPDTSTMSTKDAADTERARAADRSSAVGQSFNVMNDQGESFIDGSQGARAADTSSNLLESIGKIFKLFG